MHDLESKLAASWPPSRWADLTVLLAVSGGADSVALLRAMLAIRPADAPGRLIAAHFNHRLRGDEAQRDERFVGDLCRQCGIECHVGRAAPGEIAGQAADGLEKAARTARYRFLAEAAGRVGARYIATAHTADDQAETILHRILRGTGVRGLAGIPRVRRLGHVALIRPVLFARRADVLAYLAAIGQVFCHDATNTDRALTRNRIRHELLPRLAADYNASVVDALLRLGTQAREMQAVIDEKVDHLLDQLVARGPEGTVAVALGPLRSQPRYLVRELLAAVWRQYRWPLRAMGFAEWEMLAEMIAQGGDARRTLPGPIDARLTADRLLLRPR